MTYKQFKSKWLGKRVDTDNIPLGAKHQCVDLPKQYLHEVFGLPYGAYGNAIDYWTKTNPIILTKFKKTKKPKQGDIVIVKGLDRRYEHIGIADSSIKNGKFELLEQNGGGGNGQGTGADAIRVRQVPANQIIGVLTPKTSVKVVQVIKKVVPSKKIYKVQDGDTLSSIAIKYKTTVENLVKLNKKAYPTLLKNPNVIAVGWKLRIK